MEAKAQSPANMAKALSPTIIHLFAAVSTLASRGRVGRAAVEREGLHGGQRRRPLVIASPHVREAAELFSQENFGRTFAFYRHPIDYVVHPGASWTRSPPGAGADNFLTRLLSDARSGPLGYKELGTAKQVIRQTTIAGTRDLMAESLFLFGKYYGWDPVHGSGTSESIESDDAIARACVNEAARDAPGERYADHDSPELCAFYEANKLDCELYEIARSTWRAQIQTGGLPPWRVAEMPDAVGGNSSCDRLDCART